MLCTIFSGQDLAGQQLAAVREFRLQQFVVVREFRPQVLAAVDWILALGGCDCRWGLKEGYGVRAVRSMPGHPWGGSLSVTIIDRKSKEGWVTPTYLNLHQV